MPKNNNNNINGFPYNDIRQKKSIIIGYKKDVVEVIYIGDLPRVRDKFDELSNKLSLDPNNPYIEICQYSLFSNNRRQRKIF